MNTKSSDYPFECFRCEQQPRDAFTHFDELDDWLMVYPDLQLIHIHFGISSTSTEENLQFADLALEWWDDLVHKYPGRRFFFVNDLTRKDDAEVVEDEAKDSIMYIRRHPQSGGGAVYGHTYAMSMVLNLLNHFTRRPIYLRRTLEECETDYQEWYQKELEYMREEERGKL